MIFEVRWHPNFKQKNKKITISGFGEKFPTKRETV